jgi:hypothetical protein
MFDNALRSPVAIDRGAELPPSVFIALSKQARLFLKPSLRVSFRSLENESGFLHYVVITRALRSGASVVFNAPACSGRSTGRG